MTANTPNAIVLQVAELARNIQQQPFTDDIDKPLGELAETAAKSVPGAEHAAITLVGHNRVRTVSATARYPILLDTIDQRHQGPCQAATWTRQAIRIDDVTAERRWPEYCRDIVDETRIRSIMSFRLFSDRHSAGVLSFYAERPHAFDGESMEVGFIMATHTALAWHMLRHEEQFRSALASRDVIGQAKGMIMERFNIDAMQAFELLSLLSQNSNTPLADIARHMVETEHPLA